MIGMSRRGVLSAVAAAVVAVGGGGGGYLAWRQHEAGQLDDAARAAVRSFAAAWSAQRLDRSAYLGRTPAEVAGSYASATRAMGRARVAVTVASVERRGDQATGQLAVTWTLGGGVAWTYREPVVVRRSASAWGVVTGGFTSLWHPALPSSASFAVRRTWGARGDLLSRDGSPLLAQGTVYDVQLDPTRASATVAAALETLTGERAGSLVRKLRAAKSSSSKAAIPVITYWEADFRARKSRLDALIGVVYPPRSQPLARARTFAQPLLGSFGPVTAELVKAGGGRYVAGDYAGLSGLQARYDAVLGGTPGVEVASSSAPGTALFRLPAKNGATVKVSLDLRVQQAAEAALAHSGATPSALVALDVGSGELLAVASSPSLGFDRALQGQYQPGSTLKVATTYSLLRQGLSPSATVPCPPVEVVDGLRIRNYEGEAVGAVPFSKDFAISCNTAFASLSRSMGAADVHDAALALGVGAGWATRLGVPGVFAGSVPPARTATDRAASAFGQGRTLVSPAALAVMAGSVARGSYVEPALVTAPAVPGADRTPKPLDAATVRELHTLMRSVVTSGTAAPAFRGLPGVPVFGKTGTAEYGTGSPPRTRAWFAGWRGDVAFAVLVEEGKSGGSVAAPVARAFLEQLG